MANTFEGAPWKMPYSAQQLQNAVANQVPRINPTNKHFEVWNINTQQWVDTGETANPGTDTIGDGSVTYSKLANDVKQLAVGENLLDNWYFVGGGSQQGGGQFPINQRGQTEYTGSGYGIDRWFTTGGSHSQTVNADSVTIKVVQHYGGILQYLEEPCLKEGQNYTLSILTANGCFQWTFSPSKSAGRQSRNGWFGVEKMYSYVDFYSNNSWRIFVFDSAVDNTEKTVDVKAVKLELGNTQTLAHQDSSGNWVLNDPPPNYQQELAKCQRYFCKSFASTVVPSVGNAIIQNATMVTVRNNASMRVLFPVEMRATPTVQKIGIAFCYAYNSDGSEATTFDEYIFPTGVSAEGFFISQSFYNGVASFGFCWVADANL